MGFYIRYATREVILSNVELRCNEKGKGRSVEKDLMNKERTTLRVAGEKKITGKKCG
jgi:hypothetical protein